MILNPDALIINSNSVECLVGIVKALIADRMDTYGSENNESQETGEHGKETASVRLLPRVDR